MNAFLHRDVTARRWVLGSWLAALSAASALAAPPVVQPFAPGTWKALQTSIKHPTAVVFSTTDCTHCPAVIDRLAQAAATRKGMASVGVVVMDVIPGEADEALQADAHLKRAGKLWAFASQPAALRYEVDPAWRGVTPYVVFLRPGAAPKAVIGPPSAADVQAWLVPAAAR